MSTLSLSRLFVRCNLMQQPYQRVQVSSLWLAQVSHVVAWFCKTLLAMRCRSYLLSDSTKHWKVTQIRQIFDCCTPDSQANLSRHQVYNNQKDSLTWVIFHCLDSTHIRSACVLFAYILRNWTPLGQTEINGLNFFIGGFAYRLCKLGKEGFCGITEECFQEGHLKFDGPDSWLQLLSKDTVVATIRQTAIRVTQGTTPAEGSEWTTWPWSDIRDTFGDNEKG